jgi:hypothetical protein
MAGFVLVLVRVIGLYLTSMPVVSRLASNQTLTTAPCVKLCTMVSRDVWMG